MDTLECELGSAGFGAIAGIDEAGRGPLAGPVVTAAVILGPTAPFIEAGIRDSKKLSATRRDTLYDFIVAHARSWSVASRDHTYIDRYNILAATLDAMAEALHSLDVTADFVLIDGNRGIRTAVEQRTVVKGDALSVTIAAASIIAKVTRDRIMDDLHGKFPQYGFDRHRGYPTPEHLESIRMHGPSPFHRITFRGVKEYSLEKNPQQ